MTLKYQVETLEGVDEAAQTLYKEQDGGGFVLQVEGVVPKSDFDALNQKAVDATTEAARRRKTLERVTGKLGLDSADGLDDALEALMAKPQSKQNDADQQAIIDQIKAQGKSEADALRDENKALKMGGAKDALKAAILGAKFHPEIVDDITQTAMNRVQLDDEGKLRIMGVNGKPLAGSGSDGFATYADLAEELAAAKPSFLVDAGKGGGGKPPASGVGTGKAQTASRSEVDTMSQSDRASFFSNGGKIA